MAKRLWYQEILDKTDELDKIGRSRTLNPAQYRRFTDVKKNKSNLVSDKIQKNKGTNRSK